MSRNPYAHSGSGEGAPDPSLAGAIDPRAADYEAAVGPNADYYRPRFERYDSAGAGLGWHWPAFFATSPWFIYRKMYLIGILNFVYPFVMWIGAGIVIAVTRDPRYSLVGLGLIVLPWILWPIFANRIYWRRIRRVIAEVPAGGMSPDPARRAALLESEGGVARGPMIVAVCVMAFIWIAIIGVIAAIAIPAYQDYAIRVQVSEGLNLASGFKAGVTEYYAKHEEWPADAKALELASLQGKYTESITVERGSIVIVYGRQAVQVLQGRTIILVPGATDDGDVAWACGYRFPRTVKNWAPGPTGTDIAPKYLPAACRSTY